MSEAADVGLRYFPTHLLTHNTYWAWCVNNKWWVVAVEAKTMSQEQSPALIYHVRFHLKILALSEIAQ